MKFISAILAMTITTIASAQVTSPNGKVEQLPPIPDVPAKQAVNSVKMADSNTFMEVDIDLPITDGPFKPNWESIEKNYPGTPQWLRDSKFGIWVHFGRCHLS